MRRFGFQTFDALDPSEGMLAIAKEKGLYRNYICKAIGKEQLSLPAGISMKVERGIFKNKSMIRKQMYRHKLITVQNRLQKMARIALVYIML